MWQLLKFLLIAAFLGLKNAQTIPPRLVDKVHNVKMGELDSYCDDAKDLKLIDWNESPVNYTCYNPRNPILVDKDIDYIIANDVPPDSYYPQHKCLFTNITYKEAIPMYGNHRPNWAKFGEYEFVPPHRWLHNVEHGSIILLYHPCVMLSELQKAKRIVRNCLWKHVITASNQLSTFRPICVVAWGHKIEMNYVDEHVLTDFIKEYAHKGPEGNVFTDGFYEKFLLRAADYPKNSTSNMKALCP